MSTNDVTSITAATSDTEGVVCNRFVNEKEFVDILTWQAPAIGASSVVSYSIYRDSALTELVATVPATIFSYADHNRKHGVAYTYYIVARDASGDISSPAIVVVNPVKS